MLKKIISALLLAGAVIAAAGIISTEKLKQELRIDLSEVNHIRYSLLNVEQWSVQIKEIMEKKILELEITPENEAKLRRSIEVILHRLIDEVELIIRERTSGPFPELKRWIVGMTIDVDQLRDSVPSFSGSVLQELEGEETLDIVRDFLFRQLDSYVESTRNVEQLQSQDELWIKYGCTSAETCSGIIQEKIHARSGRGMLLGSLLFVSVLMIFLLNLIRNRSPGGYQAVLLVLSTAVLLVVGVTTPMIQLEARIDMIRFFLLGEEMRFSNNILYFQSKSILDVVGILIREGAPEVVFVGILIFTFSIIFPTLKLLSSLIIRFSGERLKNNRLIRFFALKSGKWSMADVMVVAIFMAYIGFNGIVNDQMTGLTENTGSTEVITTNGTQLLLGFYLFLSFCISSLVLSEVLIRKDRQEDHPPARTRSTS